MTVLVTAWDITTTMHLLFYPFSCSQQGPKSGYGFICVLLLAQTSLKTTVMLAREPRASGARKP